MHVLESETFLSQAIEGSTPVVVCFSADWCGDCHFLKPSLPDLEARFGSQATFVLTDIDRFPRIAQEHEVTGIPSFILFHRGREVSRLVNERRKTKDEVRQFLEQGLSLIH